MHEERLRQLHDFLPLAEAHADDCRAAVEDAEALVRATKAAIAKETRERRHLRGLPLLFPAALAAAGAAGRWAWRNSAGVAAGATVATVAAVGITQLGDDPPTARRVVTAPAPPAASSPPAGHTPAPTSPPKGSPTPAPAPSQPSPDTPPPISGATPPSHKPPGKPHKSHKPPNPHKPPTPPGKPPGMPPAGDPSTTTEDCRINLLGIEFLCGHLVSSGQLPAGWPLS